MNQILELGYMYVTLLYRFYRHDESHQDFLRQHGELTTPME